MEFHKGWQRLNKQLELLEKLRIKMCYREMKRKAKVVKDKIALIRQKQKAKVLAEELTEDEFNDLSC